MTMDTGAYIDPTGVYRYLLWRVWDYELPLVAFVMLNPSIADANQDDPTIRRCVGFARTWGMGGVKVVNLYAYRATDPADMWLARDRGVDIVGPQNDQWMDYISHTTSLVVAAWGTNAEESRVGEMLQRFPLGKVHRLGTPTKGGHPRHPLYVRGDTQLEAL